MRTHRRSTQSTVRRAIERALLARDRREIASIERLMKALHLDTRKNSPPRRTLRSF
jgi:hypothetical protein